MHARPALVLRQEIGKCTHQHCINYITILHVKLFRRHLICEASAVVEEPDLVDLIAFLVGIGVHDSLHLCVRLHLHRREAQTSEALSKNTSRPPSPLLMGLA